MTIALALPLFLAAAPAVPERSADLLFALEVHGGEDLRARVADNEWLRLATGAGLAAVSAQLGEEEAPDVDEWLGELESLSVHIGAGDHALYGTVGVLVRGSEGGRIEALFDDLGFSFDAASELLSEEGAVKLYSGEGMGWDLPSGASAVEVALLRAEGAYGLALSDGQGFAGALASAMHSDPAGRPAELVQARELLAGAHLSMHADLGALLVDLFEADPTLAVAPAFLIDPMLESLAGLEPLSVAVRFGAGRRVDGVAQIGFDPETVLGDITEMFTPFDPELARWVPAGSSVLQVAGVDFPTVVDALLEVFAEAAPEEFDAFEAGVEDLVEQTGVHPIDDVVALLSGSVVTYFTDLPDLAALEEGTELPLGLGYVFALSDSEAFHENLLAIVEPTGVLDWCEVEELSGGTLYDLSGFGLPMAVTVGAGGLGLQIGEEALDYTRRLLDAEEVESALDDEVVERAMIESEGAVAVSIVDIDFFVAAFIEGYREGFGAESPLEIDVPSVDGTVVLTMETAEDAWVMRFSVR